MRRSLLHLARLSQSAHRRGTLAAASGRLGRVVRHSGTQSDAPQPADPSAAAAASQPATAPRFPPSRLAIDAVRAADNLDELRMRVTAFRLANSRFGHASFVNAALDRLDELQAKGDLDLYNELLSIFPEDNRFKTATLLDAIWPKQSVQVDTALRCLDRMEDNLIIPETSTFETVLLRFGKASQPVKKTRAMAYWMRRYLFANPFALPETLPESPADRVLLYLKRMASHDVYVLDVEDARIEGWAAAYSQSPEQHAKLREAALLPAGLSQIAVHGLHPVWMRDRRLSFAVLSTAAVGSSGNRYDSTQEAVLGTMMCLNADGNCPGPNSDAWNAALQAWLRNLDVRVPELSRTAVAVRITDPSADAVTEEEEEGNEDEELVAAEEVIIKDVSPEGTPRRN